ATARLNCACAAGAQEVEKFTVPSCSPVAPPCSWCWARALPARRSDTTTPRGPSIVTRRAYPTRLEPSTLLALAADHPPRRLIGAVRGDGPRSKPPSSDRLTLTSS